MAADEAQWDSFIFPWWKLFIDWPYFGNKTSGEITDTSCKYSNQMDPDFLSFQRPQISDSGVPFTK